MLEKILATQNVKPNEAVFVGDARGDVAMARAANIEPIIVLTGHLGKSEARALGIKQIIDDVTKLEDVLKII